MTGFGMTVGPASIVSACGNGATLTLTLPETLSPVPSVTVTETAHTCWLAVRLRGAVHVGFWAVALGKNVPAAPIAGQLAAQL